ncbi:carboxyl-terminal protease [Desulfarculus baarsii DSM 2075]|uniref:Carboxyl-terminal protease n=2 Tax=Desulfarculus baarsii TaxID=453230 RepID=E1QHU3_DESB2|nr:carboxyl-terminal protease [Desulfarculus baarsii DSM 2075]
MRRGQMRIPMILAAIVGLAMLLAPYLPTPQSNAASDDEYQQMRLLTEVLEEIKQKYVEEKTSKDLIQRAIKGMVDNLDPHSSYMSPEEFKDLQIETKGSFYGVGIEITSKDGVLTVVSPIEDTPAYKAGVKAGDRIIKIDGKLTKGMTTMDAVKSIRGAQGSKVVLTVMRDDAPQLIDIAITRDLIPLHSVRYNLLEDGYGYIRISNFQETTTRDLIEALQTLQSQKTPLRGLVLDLRNDPGGLLQEAVTAADQFLSGGVIVSTKGRNKNQDMVFNATPTVTAGDYPIIVLINQGSASASEILAGALQDHKRAMVVGSPSFGKGSVQTIIPLGDNGALRLTTARYYTPNGRSIQAKGIEPDLVVPFDPPEEEAKDKPAAKDQSIREKDLTGAIAAEGDAAKADKKSDSKLYYAKDKLDKDNQLRRALDLLKAWQVFAPMSTKNTAAN